MNLGKAVPFLLAAGFIALLAVAHKMPSSPPPSAKRHVIPKQGFEAPPRRASAPRPNVPKGPRGTFLALVYGGNGHGEIESCG